MAACRSSSCRVSIFHRTDEALAEVDALAERLGGRVGIDGLLGDLQRRMRRSIAPGLKVGRAFRWNLRDGWDKRWWPQGITNSADASDTEDIAGRKVLATSWYAKDVAGVNQGSRITVVDLKSRRYRHVLLVVHVAARRRAAASRLNVHAGGLVWCGPYLHVAATRRGLFTGRVDDILRVRTSSGTPTATGSASTTARSRRSGILRAAGELRLPGHRRRRGRAAALLVPLVVGPAPIRSWSPASTAGRHHRAAGPAIRSTRDAPPVPSEDGVARPVCSRRAASATCRAPRWWAVGGTSPARVVRGASAHLRRPARATSAPTLGAPGRAGGRQLLAVGRTRCGRSSRTPGDAGCSAVSARGCG